MMTEHYYWRFFLVLQGKAMAQMMLDIEIDNMPDINTLLD